MSPNEERREKKHSTHFCCRFCKQAGVFIVQELICKRLLSIMFVFLHHSSFQLSPFRKLTNVNFWDKKYKQEVECLPLALSSKRHVLVLPTKGKKFIKARTTFEERLSHLACKNEYPRNRLIYFPVLNCCTSSS